MNLSCIEEVCSSNTDWDRLSWQVFVNFIGLFGQRREHSIEISHCYSSQFFSQSTYHISFENNITKWVTLLHRCHNETMRKQKSCCYSLRLYSLHYHSTDFQCYRSSCNELQSIFILWISMLDLCADESPWTLVTSHYYQSCLQHESSQTATTTQNHPSITEHPNNHHKPQPTNHRQPAITNHHQLPSETTTTNYHQQPQISHQNLHALPGRTPPTNHYQWTRTKWPPTSWLPPNQVTIANQLATGNHLTTANQCTIVNYMTTTKPTDLHPPNQPITTNWPLSVNWLPNNWPPFTNW